jgi:hypothetical protein
MARKTTLTTSVQYCIGTPSQSNDARKRSKRLGKEMKLSLFACNMRR